MITARRLSLFQQVLGAIVLLALVLRLVNLGCFSLWLDEVFQVERARGPLSEVWCSTGPDVHPPLSALVMSAGFHLGLSDTGQRLVPVALGVLSILLLAAWARRRFGSLVAATVACLAALSPFHLRYSQELRPYPYLLFFVVLALVVVDRMVASGRVAWALPGGLVVAGGLYAHSLFPLVAVPLVVTAALVERGARRTACVNLALAAGVGVAVFAPWLPKLVRIAGTGEPPSAQAWTLRELTRRWQFLTVGGWEGADLTWGGGLLLALALIGVVRAVQRARQGGLEVLVGALVGLVGVELLFHFVWQRWSVGRYSVIGWPFLAVLVALGIEWILRSRVRVLGVATVLALAWCHVVGLHEYFARGREHWDAMAEVIRAVRRPGEPVLTANLFCQYPLDYYLRRANEGDTPSVSLLPLDRDLARLLALWPEDSSCLLARGGTPHNPAIRRVASQAAMVVGYSESQWLYRLPPRRAVAVGSDGALAFQPRDLGRPWPDPDLVLPPDELRDPPSTWLGRAFPRRVGARPATSARLELDRETSSPYLLSGWSGFETTATGETFAWAAGMEAGVLLPVVGAGPLTVEARLWPFAPPGRTQWLRAVVNGHELGVAKLARGPQTLQAQVPASLLRPTRNLLVLQFAHAVAPASIDPSSRDHRPLACAVDWIAVSAVAR